MKVTLYNFHFDILRSLKVLITFTVVVRETNHPLNVSPSLQLWAVVLATIFLCLCQHITSLTTAPLTRGCKDVTENSYDNKPQGFKQVGHLSIQLDSFPSQGDFSIVSQTVRLCNTVSFLCHPLPGLWTLPENKEFSQL